jgi:hypothetical protein
MADRLNRVVSRPETWASVRTARKRWLFRLGSNRRHQRDGGRVCHSCRTVGGEKRSGQCHDGKRRPHDTGERTQEQTEGGRKHHRVERRMAGLQGVLCSQTPSMQARPAQNMQRERCISIFRNRRRPAEADRSEDWLECFVRDGGVRSSWAPVRNRRTTRAEHGFGRRMTWTVAHCTVRAF